jgi:large subunit ribosomal protein L1
MAKRGKRYEQAKAELQAGHEYHPMDAVRIIKRQEVGRFDSTIEVHFRLGVNVRHADQQLRGTVSLPHGSGRTVRVAVFAEGEKAKEAEAAGADFVGGEDLAKKIQEGFDDFDLTIATPDMMGIVGRLGRVLGPSGKMPNPKTGTVTMDVAKAVEEVKSGKIEYRTDRTGIVHVGIGKRSFGERELVENYQAVIEEIVRVKPAAAKGRYLRSIVITETMGPGIPLDTTKTTNLLEDVPAPA